MDIVEQILEQMSNLNERLGNLETAYNDMLGCVVNAKDEYEFGVRRDEFRSKHADKFAEFNDKLRAIEGDDFDICDKAFNDYDSLEGEKLNEEEYIAALIAKVSEQLKKIAQAYGVAEIEADKDGD